MPRPSRPRIRLSDLMCFVAATAVAVVWASRLSRGQDHLANFGIVLSRLVMLQFQISMVIPFLFMGTLCVLGLGLRRPLHRVARQPGLAACLAFSVQCGYSVYSQLVALVIKPFVNFGGPTRVSLWTPLGLFTISFWTTGALIAATWLTLILGSGWRAQPDWIDRAGRVLGLGWIAFFLLQSGLSALQ